MSFIELAFVEIIRKKTCCKELFFKSSFCTINFLFDKNRTRYPYQKTCKNSGLETLSTNVSFHPPYVISLLINYIIGNKFKKINFLKIFLSHDTTIHGKCRNILIQTVFSVGQTSVNGLSISHHRSTLIVFFYFMVCRI